MIGKAPKIFQGKNNNQARKYRNLVFNKTNPKESGGGSILPPIVFF
jgi:hypothetical protein